MEENEETLRLRQVCFPLCSKPLLSLTRVVVVLCRNTQRQVSSSKRGKKRSEDDELNSSEDEFFDRTLVNKKWGLVVCWCVVDCLLVL